MSNLILNLINAICAAAALINIYMSWYLFGASKNADQWMLALTIIQSISLISQAGVEQYPVYYARYKALGSSLLCEFQANAMGFALICGLFFGGGVYIISNEIILIYSAGSDLNQDDELTRLLRVFVSQIFVMPILFVIKQILLIDGRRIWAILINSMSHFVILASLITGWLFDARSPLDCGYFASIYNLIGFLLIFFLVNPERKFKLLIEWSVIKEFAISSCKMRGIHSIHNFLLSIVISSYLSHGVNGTIATYQYLKKIADGLCSITMGPHAAVYHAEQASSFAAMNRNRLVSNIYVYIYSAVPMFLFGLSLAFLAYFSFSYYDVNLKIGSEVISSLLILLLWQFIVAIETVPVGLLIVANSAPSILKINTIFIMQIFILTYFTANFQVFELAVIGCYCQAISLLMYSYTANAKLKKLYD